MKYEKRRRKPWLLLTVSISFSIPFVSAQQPISRWGQASAVVGTTLYVHGGKTDPTHAFPYATAPNTNQLLTLDLSATFSLNSPPWVTVNSTTSPAIAFHTLSPYSSTGMLLFGGMPTVDTPIATNPDSAWLLDVSDPSNPAWTLEPENWASEPERRLHHSAVVTKDGKIWITGGEKGDGSHLGFDAASVFDPTVPSFSSIDATNGPAQLIGHASVMLSNGTLLLIGGFTLSLTQPQPLSTIFAIDTTASQPSWYTVTAAGNVPANRRGFAAVVLPSDKVLIHGGVDGFLQNPLSDGAILDTSGGTVSWSTVDQLSSLGPRFDHLAVAIGDQVLFGFGFGDEFPASDAISLFDTKSGAFLDTFTPSKAPPNTNNPPPTTSTQPGPTGGTGTTPTTGDGTQPPSTSSGQPRLGDPPATNHDAPSNTTAIALGSVFGFLALVALVGVGGYYIRRRHQDRRGRWSSLGGESDGHDVVMVGGWQDPRAQPWTRRLMMNFGGGGDAPRGPYRERFDILADEDAAEYALGAGYGIKRGLSTTSSRSGHPKTWGSVINASMTSLRSVGAAFGIRRSMSESGTMPLQPHHSPQQSYASPSKMRSPSDPFMDSNALEHGEGIGQGVTAAAMAVGLATRPRLVGREISTASSRYSYSSQRSARGGYTDPFADQALLSTPEEEAGEMIYHDEEGYNHDEATPLAQALPQVTHASIARSSGRHALALPPLTLTTSNTTSTDQVTSPTSQGPSSPTVRGSSSATSHGATSQATLNSKGSRTSGAPVLGSFPLALAPISPTPTGNSQTASGFMKRSDSWWARFSREAFYPRSASHSHVDDGYRGSELLVDVRDPNPPPPRLGAISESTHSLTPEASTNTPDTHKRLVSSKAEIVADPEAPGFLHGRSTSSFRSAKTANSAAIERLGHMDVVQRVRTQSSHHTAGSTPGDDDDGDDTRRTSHILEPSDDSFVESPTAEERPTLPSPKSAFPSNNLPSAFAQQVSARRSPRLSPPPVARPSLTPVGGVSARVQAYERRLSQDQSQPMRSPDLDRKRISYGLAPKPKLFVANASPPDI